MDKQEFISLTGEDPEDVLGPDWENYIEDFLNEQEPAETRNRRN